ncbi:MAG TPA: ParB N-terminal domain-containing protein [Candidatus Krumholzibacteria bacterium]|nr:ParB N-terminal domain-containing protein [Candidatus Krumholzibacteria bacterium]
MQGDLRLLRPGDLRPHEDVDPERVTLLADEIRTAGAFYPPVLVDDATRVILDGHHRWRASTALGLGLLPCYCVDYMNDVVVRVISRRPEITVTKADVIAMALAGRVYPQKTTRHMYDLPETLGPIPLRRLAGA